MFTQLPPIDPSRMRTEEGQRLAARIEVAEEISWARVNRLSKVLGEFIFFTRNLQLDLAECAIVWAFVSLPRSVPTEACELNFYSTVEIMYAVSEYAEKSMSEAERGSLYSTACASRDNGLAEVSTALNSAARALRGLAETNPVRMIGEMLHGVRQTFLEHAPLTDLRDLVAYSAVFCSATGSLLVGAGSEVDVSNALRNLANSALGARSAVHDAIRQGKLLVEDGRILNPRKRNI